MYLRFYLDENNRRVYTLKKTTPAGLETQSAHPARFSPEDKNSKYRIIIKKRFGLLPTQQSKQHFNNFFIHFVMLLWEWRRIFRQKLRSLSGKSTLTYQQWSRRRLFVSFVLFFVGWKVIGYTLNDMLLWTTDEETGIGRFLSPKEARDRKYAAEKAREERLPSRQQPSQKYALDD